MSETLDESKRNKRTAKRILAIGLPLVLIGSVGVGYAFWTSNGTGNGTASAGSTSTLNVSVPVVSGVAPGVPTAPVTITAANPGSSDVTISSLTATVPTTGLTTGCTDALASVTAAPVIAAASVVVPAGNVPVAIGTVTLTMANTSSDQNACKGASFTFSVTAS